MIFTQTISLAGGDQPLNYLDEDYLSFFNADIQENLEGYYVGEKWNNLFSLGLFIQNLSISKNANISSAKIWIEEYTSNHPENITIPDNDVALTLSYEDTDNSAVFSNGLEYGDRLKSTSSMSISHLGEIDITSFIRKITSHAGWVNGNNACLFLDHDAEAWQTHYNSYVEDISLSLTNGSFFKADFKVEVIWCESSNSITEAFPTGIIGVSSIADANVNVSISDFVDTLLTVDLELGHSEFSGYKKTDTIQWFIDSWGSWFTIGEEISPNPQSTMVGLQYRDVGLPQGQSITSATLRFPLANTEPYGEESLLATVRYEDVDTAANFTDQTDFDGRTKSTQSLSRTLTKTAGAPIWDGRSWIDSYQVEIDVTDLMQSILSRPGWSSGNNVVFFIESSDVAGNFFQISSGDGFFYLDINYLSEQVETVDSKHFQTVSVGATALGTGYPGTMIHSFSSAVVGLSALGNLHTDTTMVEPHPYTATAFNLIPYSIETFFPSKINISTLNDETFLFDMSGDIWAIYLGYLTGYQNGLDEICLPLSSFQATLRSGEQSYLQIVTPAIEFAQDVSLRPDGDIRVVMAQVKAGKVINTEEIARVSLDYISIAQGGVNQSITLSGHKTETTSPKIVALENGIYEQIADGKKRVRFPEVDMYLKPGDTVVYDGSNIVADIITIYMSVGQRQMEIAEK